MRAALTIRMHDDTFALTVLDFAATAPESARLGRKVYLGWIRAQMPLWDREEFADDILDAIRHGLLRCARADLILDAEQAADSLVQGPHGAYHYVEL